MTVDEYLASLPEDRRAAIDAIRRTINEHIAPGFEEGIDFGMIGWHVPLERFPDTYNGHPLGIIALANQKHHMALYLMGVYSDDAEARWFTERWRATGKKLDMGKSCVRFKKLDDVPLDVVAEVAARTSPDELIVRARAARDRPARARARRPAT